MKYFYADKNNQPVGPYELEDLRQLNVQCQVRPETLVCEEGGTAWKPFSMVLISASGVQPPMAPPPPRIERKSKLAAGLLGILLGCFGIHNFYLGFAGKGVAQLLITILTCGILSFVSAIWGIIEGILILTGSINQDASGVALGD